MKFRMAGLTLAVILLANQSLLAAPQWQQTLIDDGWVEIKRKLKDFADYTWYGQSNQSRSTVGYVYYLRPGGKTGVLRTPDGKTYVDHRQEGKNGRICSLIKELRGGKQYCGNTLWKRDDLYMFTNPDGRVIHTWKWTKGNAEGFILD